MKVTVHSHIDGRSWTSDVPQELIQDTAWYSVNDQLYRLFQRVDEASAERLASWGYMLPSLSAGDRLEYGNMIWLVESVGFELISTSKLEALQGRYDRLVAHRGRAVRYYDECPDGDPRKEDARRQLAELGTQVGEVEHELDQEVEWLDRKQQGIRVDRMLYPLPAGTEFRLGPGPTVSVERLVGGFLVGTAGVTRAYVATYRKNDAGLWDQVQGTCEPPHVVNMSADHLGFVVGEKPIREALGMSVEVAS